MDFVWKSNVVINLTKPVALEILQILAEKVHWQDDRLNLQSFEETDFSLVILKCTLSFVHFVNFVLNLKGK